MRSIYGDSLFQNYFIFDDKRSYVWCDPNHDRRWNQRMIGDSIYSCHIFYRFTFPGAKVHPFYVSSFDLNSNGEFENNPKPPYYGRRIKVSTETMDKIAQDSLGKVLKECTVQIYYSTYFYDTPRGRNLDSSHVYLELQYRKRTGGTKRGDYFQVWTWSVIVDGSTGEIIGKQESYFNGNVGYF